jgi:hypothetical protein
VRRKRSLREVGRAEWLALGAVGVIGLLGFVAPANAANKAISTAYTTSGTNCTVPQGQIYTAEGLGIWVDPNNSANQVVVCTAYSSGNTAWQYCNHTTTGDPHCNVGDNPATITHNQVFLLSVEAGTAVAKSQQCSSGLIPWGSTASCNYSNGLCTWSAFAVGIN